MSTDAFPPLPGLAFEGVLAGSECFARYRDESSNAARTVERRATIAGVATVEALRGNGRSSHLARVSAVHVVGATTYVVYVDGFACSLPARMRDRSWVAASRAHVLAQLAEALHDLHGHGIGHGDLSPDAILLDASGDLRLAALSGAAAAPAATSQAPGELHTLGPTLTRARATGGALAYLAPEQFVSGTATLESDTFAWGCIAYEIATGRAPFGFLTEATKLLEAVTRGPTQRVHDLEPSFTETFDADVRTALAFNRKDRALPRPIPARWVHELTADAETVAVSKTPGALARWLVPALTIAVALAAIGYFVVSR